MSAMPSLRRLQQYAIAISVASIVWNGVEGGLSIGFGAESESRSLVFFGIQSAIEVISAIIVVWRFMCVAKPGEEQGVCLSPRELRFEKYSTIAIGALLLALAIATTATASAGLALHISPDASTPALAISASALVVMLCIWLPKRHLARALNSAAMQGEAACSLACIQITVVLFVGALAYRVHHAAWWLDGATAIVLSILFAAEGGKMLRWACSPAFDGGCCDHRGRGTTKDVEMPTQYRDVCACCDEKDACKNAEVCQCPGEGCCELKEDGKCCTRELRTGVRPSTTSQVAQSGGDNGTCCAPTPQHLTPCLDDCCAAAPAAEKCCADKPVTDSCTAPSNQDKCTCCN